MVEGVTMIRVGGHFDGSAVLYWENKVFHADSFMVVPVLNPSSSYLSSFPPYPTIIDYLCYSQHTIIKTDYLEPQATLSCGPIPT